MSEALAEPTEIDRFEAELAKLPRAVMPFANIFTPGLYLRAIHMPAGTALSSRIHKHDHPFIILKGEIAVKSGTEETIYRAPHIGITPAGTRRALYALHDTVWATVHPNPENCTVPDEMVERLTDDPANPLAGENESNAWQEQQNGTVTLISDGMKLLTHQEP